jgi:hypothetical protein
VTTLNKKETRDNDIPEGWSLYRGVDGDLDWKWWLGAIAFFSGLGFIIYYFIWDILLITVYMLIAFVKSIPYESGL